MSLVETLILYVVVVSNYTLEILKDTIFSGRGEGRGHPEPLLSKS